MTSGLGFIVSKLPLGIWRTRLIVLGTAVTIRDPRSTLRVSHSGRGVSDDVRLAATATKGAKWATWAVVV